MRKVRRSTQIAVLIESVVSRDSAVRLRRALSLILEAARLSVSADRGEAGWSGVPSDRGSNEAEDGK